MKRFLAVGLVAMLSTGCAALYSPIQPVMTPLGPELDERYVVLLDGSVPGVTDTVAIDGGCLVIAGGAGADSMNPHVKRFCLFGRGTTGR